MLHAELLGFEHPITGEHMEFISSIPEDMQKALEKLT
jgi:23S rRNA-/tRNA-specific pseudouridylate synthase